MTCPHCSNNKDNLLENISKLAILCWICGRVFKKEDAK